VRAAVLAVLKVISAVNNAKKLKIEKYIVWYFELTRRCKGIFAVSLPN